MTMSESLFLQNSAVLVGWGSGRRPRWRSDDSIVDQALEAQHLRHCELEQCVHSIRDGNKELRTLDSTGDPICFSCRYVLLRCVTFPFVLLRCQPLLNGFGRFRVFVDSRCNFCESDTSLRFPHFRPRLARVFRRMPEFSEPPCHARVHRCIFSALPQPQ